MSDHGQNFAELAGRLEGAVRSLLLLASTLEMSGVLDGPRYAATVARIADQLAYNAPSQPAAKRTMQEIAAALNDSRQRRARVSARQGAGCRWA
ncbi:hypothetical protein [Sapientia aquatica]|uniref:Uncharacterized protein n=1 Tax=Sapientia aquatica TaxID=1549640 RepID=A0A4R5W1E1_9BURK|nr:hypothetical protein [Sapientia aquatica]TDK66001.1 hypothetical protein E2I14_10435 [Sapientia aquatica]